ncbi:hypothetical protein JI721_14120 [Alicyclobacillus cycloheptanicus]|uniref:Uncharacterized protein n=1 Tax=Alicyclobacillus cycloheptanicus TaxID=1457 RepID=A0ABT9XM12_9BACL|nr:hypothetical protein [Alicyclobacillus cycloheptanicus]MDQ0191325.1 hypothetical protein [Alicyclobacillus cycloheptanicus]WDM00814.1 hypothetical protein JI721_14120 [Alicyclobacillus cycloheptanicus]
MPECPEVHIGRVEIPGEDYARIQQAADQGRNLWRLSPVRTAQVVGTEHLGLRANDIYTLREQYIESGSGLRHAVVEVTHGPCRFLVELYQPERQGSRGIWVVEDVTPL